MVTSPPSPLRSAGQWDGPTASGAIWIWAGRLGAAPRGAPWQSTPAKLGGVTVEREYHDRLPGREGARASGQLASHNLGRHQHQVDVDRWGGVDRQGVSAATGPGTVGSCRWPARRRWSCSCGLDRWLVHPNVVGRNLFSFGHDATLARVAGQQQQHHFGQCEALAALYQSQPGELVGVAANNEVQNLDVQFECILLINHHSSKHHHHHHQSAEIVGL